MFVDAKIGGWWWNISKLIAALALQVSGTWAIHYDFMTALNINNLLWVNYSTQYYSDNLWEKFRSK